jgi:hypothetical protein
MIDVGREEPPFQSLHITRKRSVAVVGDHMMAVTADGEATVYSNSAMKRLEPGSDPDRDTRFEVRFALSKDLDELVVQSNKYYGTFEFSIDGPLKKLSAFGVTVEHSKEGRIVVYTDGPYRPERIKSDPSQSITQVRFGSGDIRAVVGNADVEIGSSGGVVVRTRNVVAQRPARMAPEIQPGPFEFAADRCSVSLYGTRMETEFMNRRALNIYTAGDAEVYTTSARQSGDIMPDGHQYAGKIYLGPVEHRGPYYMDPPSLSPVTLPEAKKMAAESCNGFLPTDWLIYNAVAGRDKLDKTQLSELFGQQSLWLSHESKNPDPEYKGVSMDPATKEQRYAGSQEKRLATVMYTDKPYYR